MVDTVSTSSLVSTKAGQVHTWERDYRSYQMRAPSRKSADELVDLLAGFAEDARVPEEFDELVDEEEESTLDDEEDAEDDAAEGEATWHEALGSDAEEIPADAKASFFSSIGEEWSRPLMLSRLVERLHGAFVLRLQTSRFQMLVQQLQEAGLEVQLQDGTPVGTDSGSPGVQAKVRLRKARGDRQPSRDPLVIVSKPPQPTQPSQRSLGPYSLALNRLKFLTALPDTERRRSPRWPDQYLEASTHGLQLTEHERRYLLVVAAGFVVGSHAPSHAVAELRDVLSPAQWEDLFDAFQRLNDHMADIAQQATQTVRELLSLPGRGEAATGTAPTEAAPAWPQSQAAAPAATSHNERGLGALDDMFADLFKK
jgi:hypothetical protein